MSEPTREVFFNITQIWVMYVLLAPTLLIFGYGIYRRVHRWRSLGRAEKLPDQPGKRLWRTLQQVLLHRALLRDRRYRSAGVGHFLFFAGFLILFAATTVVMIHEDLNIRIMTGSFYLYFQSLVVDIFGVLALIGVGMAFYQRYLPGSRRLKPDHPTDAVILLSFFVILLTGFVLEGLRIELTRDVWGNWSPVGRVFGTAGAHLMGVETMRTVHWFTWWFHLVLVYGFIAYLPYSKLMHIFTSPLNIYCSDPETNWAQLRRVDLESESTFGAAHLKDFSWRQLLSLDACTECGRCEINCPAFLSQKPLSPKKLVLDLQHHMHSLPPASQPSAGSGASDPPASSLIGPVIDEETLWSCTACGACLQQCPVNIEPVPLILEMRRFLVMEEAEFPADLQNAIRSLEARGHPYAGVSASRTEWAEGLQVPLAGETDDFEVLYWVGCAGAFNERNRQTARALARSLQRAGVSFAVLGNQETCTGDPARRIGHEYLFEMLARRNIETLNAHREKKIVTACPHCYSCLKNDYAQLGARLSVFHHTQILDQLVREGRLRPEGASAGSLVFHDPCYLGRYNQEYDAPRRVMDVVPASGRVEVEMSREKSLCCGGGGGFSFMEETRGTRMSHRRTQQLVDSGAARVAVGCPFCMGMIEDAVRTKAPAGTLEVVDIAELVEEATRAPGTRSRDEAAH